MSDENAAPEPPRRPPSSRGGRRGRATRASDPSRPCLNCGDPTPGRFCPTCGQRKVEVQVSVRAMVSDLLEDQFFLDRRLPKTLVPLLFRPGFLTTEHVNGRIVRYIRPFRLYLVSSIIFFVLLSFMGLRAVRGAIAPSGGGGVVTADSVDRGGLAGDSVRVEGLEGQIERLRGQLEDTTLTAGTRAQLATTLERTAAALDSAAARLDSATARAAQEAPDTASGLAGRADSVEARPPVTAADTVGTPWLRDTTNLDIDTPFPAVNRAIRRRATALSYLAPREALETVIRDFLNYVPTMMFILLPVFAVVLKLLYVRRRRFYAEHFVFLLHAHAFVYLLLTVMLLAREYVAAWLEFVLVGWILVYIYLAMKRVYGQGWIKTFVKYWILGWMYFWILTFAFPVAAVVAILLG